METDKLIEIVKLQSEIIEILSREYRKVSRHRDENGKMRQLTDNLIKLQRELE